MLPRGADGCGRVAEVLAVRLAEDLAERRRVAGAGAQVGKRLARCGGRWKLGAEGVPCPESTMVIRLR